MLEALLNSYMACSIHVKLQLQQILFSYQYLFFNKMLIVTLLNLPSSPHHLGEPWREFSERHNNGKYVYGP